jgi:hypothetical protein
MRGLGQFLLIGCLLTIPAAAQRGGGRGGSGGFHGGMAGGFHGGGFVGSGFHGGYGGFHGGFNGFHGGFRYFRGGYRYYSGYGYYPWGYAGWWGYPYYGYPYYNYTYPSYSYSSSDDGYTSSASSPVVIYQSQTPAVVYSVPQQPEIRTSFSQRDEKPVYLIALKGQDNICAAQTYWVTQNTLHFITLEGDAKQVPVSSVDRAFTFRLNWDRQVDFRLPPDK